jgi:hypothetical protein
MPEGEGICGLIHCCQHAVCRYFPAYTNFALMQFYEYFHTLVVKFKTENSEIIFLKQKHGICRHLK